MIPMCMCVERAAEIAMTWVCKTSISDTYWQVLLRINITHEDKKSVSGDIHAECLTHFFVSPAISDKLAGEHGKMHISVE